MGKALVITEKPSVARDIAKALGGFREEEGWFESPELVVTFAVGHLFELLSPEEIDKEYKRWTLANLPILPATFQYKAKSGQSERIRTIKKLLNRADVDRVINACDAGREGELIFREIVDHLENHKPIERLWLQSMTDDAIRQGFSRLRPGAELEGLAAAAACRARSDWLIGMNATRALTKRLKSRKEKTAWSAGRVQTPTLAMLVARELEVLAHVPRPYWRVEASFEHAGRSYAATWFDPEFRPGADDEAKDDRLFDEARARAIAERVAGRPGVASETRKPSRESAPPLFDLTSLQREGNRRFGWSARRTLSAAQRCYERHKILTYPRTDSRCLPEDFTGTVDATLASFAGLAGGDPDFADYAASAARLRRDGLQNTARIFDNAGISDHFAIVPTGTLPSEPLSGDDKRLFDLVVRRFLGAFHPPAVWERVERISEVEGERFRTRARFLQTPGWRAVLPENDEAESRELAPLAPGRDEASGVAVANRSAEIAAEETRPPARITEARLLSLMENAGQQVEDEDHAAVLHEKGIGTPATRADIIENLISKGYVVRVDKALRPTVKGIRLIDTLNRIHADRLTSPGLTGEMEYHLTQVERGKRSAGDYMAEIADYTREIVDKAKSFEYDELYDASDVLGACPACGGPVIEYAWFYRCKEKPLAEGEADCPLRLWKDNSGRYLDRSTVRLLLRDGSVGPLDGFTARNGRTYRGNLELDRTNWKLEVRSLGYDGGAAVSDQVDYDVDPEPLGPCPLCKTGRVVETPTHFRCDPPEGAPAAECPFVLPRTVCKREITRSEALHYLQHGRTELLTEFTSRFGRPFSATLVLKESGRHGFEFQPRAGGRRGAAAEAGGEAAPATARPRRAARRGKADAPAAARPERAAKPARSGVRTKKAAARKKTAPRRKAPRAAD